MHTTIATADELERYLWRTGRRNFMTIYVMKGDEPSDDDPFVGSLCTPEAARAAVDAHNRSGRGGFRLMAILVTAMVALVGIVVWVMVKRRSSVTVCGHSYRVPPGQAVTILGRLCSGIRVLGAEQ